MNRRYVRRRYRHRPGQARPRARATCPPPARPEPAPSFDELVRARIRKLFGAPLEVVAPDPELREAVYDAVATGLRRPERPIPPDVLGMADRLRADGITVTLSACDPRDLPAPADVGFSLTEAILEERGRA